jgi:DNA-binding response OmpR family regulator/ligand-binding sensor domain-containing protein/two-component sensor histidine kinase
MMQILLALRLKSTKTMKNTAVFVCVCFLFSAISSIVHASLFVPQIIQQVNASNGGTDGVINSMVTDAYGRLWMASADGIFVYDGHSGRAVSSHLENDSYHATNSLVVAGDYVWAAGAFGLAKISVIDMSGETFESVPGDSYETLIVTASKVFLGSGKNGLNVFDLGSSTFAPFELKQFIQSTNIKAGLSINEDIWIVAYGTDSSDGFIEGGLIHIRDMDVVGVYYNEEKIALTAIRKHDDYLYLSSTNKGIVKFDLKSKTEEGSVFPFDSPPNIHDFVFDKNGCIWLASLSYFSSICDGELNTFDPSVAYTKTMPSSDLYSAHFDTHNQIVWFGGIFGGVSGIYVKTQPHIKFSLQNDGGNSLTSDEVYTVDTSSDGDLWVGYNGQGVDIIERDTLKLKNFKLGPEGSRANHVLSFLELEDSRTLVGTFGNGVLIFNPETNEVSPFVQDENEAFQRTVVLKMVEGHGFVWVATIRELLKVSLEGTIIKTLPQSELPNQAVIYSIEVIDEDRIFLGTNAGALIVDSTTFEKTHVKDLSPDESKCHGNLLAIEKMLDGRLVYTSESLCAYDPNNNSVTELMSAIELNDASGALVYDENTIIGNGGSIAIGSLSSRTSLVIDSTVGHYLDSALPHTGGITKFNGYIVAALARGLIWVKSEFSDIQNVPTNPIFLESLTVMNEKKSIDWGTLGDTLEIGYNEKVVIADFQKVDYFSSDTAFEAAMPSIIDTPLTLSRLSNFAIPTGVEGDHTISINAVDNGEVLDQFSINIRVLPPWWRTTPAYLFYFVALVLLTWAFVSFRQRKLQSDKIALTGMVERRTQELNKALEDKEKLFANISHELRTPLTIILGSIRSEAEKSKNTTNKIIESQSNRLLALVENLLALAEVRAFEESNELLNIEDKATLTVHSFESLARERGLSTELSLRLENPVISVQKGAMDLLLNNVIGNAINHAIPNTNITVTLESVNATLCITVVNEAESFDVDTSKQRFVTSDKGHTGGLGLDIIKEVTEKLGGKFTFTQDDSLVTSQASIPVQFLTDVTTDKVEKDLLDEQSGNLVGTILLVEDNPELSDFVSNLLGSSFTVHSSRNGREAIDWLESQETVPDLILSDVMMPVMDGVTLCEKVKSDRAMASIPFILLTAKGDATSKLKGYEAKADDYIVKPFNPAELESKIINLIQTFQNAKAKASHALFTSQLNTDNSFIQDFQALMKDMLSEQELNPEFVAGKMNVSARTLNRRLSAAFGMTFGELLKHMRIEVAIQLLAEGKMIKEVAFDCGFSSQSYFSQSFKQVKGVTPKEFIAKHQR